MADEAFSESLYSDLDIKDEIKRAVADMGFVNLTPIQEQAIPALLTGRDVIGQAQTGTGKTAAFGLPILQMIDPNVKKLQAVILCPTRELAVQATGEIRNFAKYMHDIKTLTVYGGQDISIQIRGLKGTQIIVGTPGRVMDHMRRHTIKMDDVKMVVLDEADEMLDMGFREDMEYILGAIEGEHQTCLFSATMPDEILKITGNFQNDPLYIKITKKELTIDRIKQYYYPVKQEFKSLALLRLIKYYDYGRSIIFCNTKGMVDELASLLSNEGFAAAGLHGDLTQKQRDAVMGSFRNGRISILIATDIAARGIDVDNVEAVFNYDIPQESEYYVHRIGRTGRSGKEGVSHTLCRSSDFRKIRDIEAVCHTKMEEKTVPGAQEINSFRQKEVLNKILDWVKSEAAGSNTEAAGAETAGADAESAEIKAEEANSEKSIAENKELKKLAKVVSDFCLGNDISVEVFAAACVAQKIGKEKADDRDDVDVNLEKKGSRGHSGSTPYGRNGRGGHDGDRSGDYRGRTEDGHRGHRDGDYRSRGEGTRRDRNEGGYRGHGEDERRDRGEGRSRSYGSGDYNKRDGARSEGRSEGRRKNSDGGRLQDRKEFRKSFDASSRDRDTSGMSRGERKGIHEKNREVSRRELQKATKDVRADGSFYKEKRRKMLEK